MNLLRQARETLCAAIEPVLPGRTFPDPLTPQQAGLAPVVWIGDDFGRPEIIGERTSVTVATFPVNVVYDGADRAQIAGLSDIKSGIHDAVAHVRGATVDGWRPQPGDPSNPNRRSCVIDVAYTITANTFCLPVPAQAAIPPQPVEV